MYRSESIARAFILYEYEPAGRVFQYNIGLSTGHCINKSKIQFMTDKPT